MLLLCNGGLQTADALDDFTSPTALLLGRGEGGIATAGNTKAGDRSWGTGGRGKLEKMDGGAGGTVSVKGELNSRLSGNSVANGPKQSSRVCYQKPRQGQTVLLPVPMLQKTSHPRLLKSSQHPSNAWGRQLLSIPQRFVCRLRSQPDTFPLI